MKPFYFISLTFGILLASQLSLRAQVIPAEAGARGSAKITGTLVSPIGIIKVMDMNFGKIVSGNAGSVQLNPDGESPVTTGEVALESAGSLFTPAVFEISDGTENSTDAQHFFTGYTITLPSQDVTLFGESGETMRVGNFTSSPSATGHGNFADGKGILRVGATLYVHSSQGTGKYVSSPPFPVTVNFY